MGDHERPRLRGPIAVVPLTLVLVGCAAPPAAPVRPAEPPTYDLASEFLSTACTAPSGAAFGTAWLAYERRHWDWYEPLYYPDADSDKERTELAGELGDRRDEVCGYARTFLAVVPAAVPGLRQQVSRLMGVMPQAPIVFTAALQWTDGNTQIVGGRDVVALNARHDSLSSLAAVAQLVSHELIHAAQEQRVQGRDAQLPEVEKSLYREGAAVYGTLLLFPERGDRVLMLQKGTLEKALPLLPRAAAEVRASLRASAALHPGRRFFQGGFSDPEFPPRIGYLVAMRVYQRLGERMGTEAAVRIEPEELDRVVDGILGELAGG